MPYAAPVVCHHCGKTDCDCQAQRLEQRRKQADKNRPSAAKRGYNYQWQTKIRPVYLGQHPFCCMCSEEGRTTIAKVVDHIDGNTSNNHHDNLRSLCKRHHDQRTARDQGFGRGRV